MEPTGRLQHQMSHVFVDRSWPNREQLEFSDYFAIVKPLVDKLLFGDLKAGGLIKIDMVKGALKFTEKKSKVKA